MQHLLSFWYGQSLNWVYTRFLHSIAILDGHFAIRDTARNLGKPLFQDYTYQGRIIGVFLRIVRILFGLVVYFLTFLVYTLFYVLWLLFPIACIVSLVGGLIGPEAIQP